MNDDEPDWGALADELMAFRRPHAGFFTNETDRAEAELYAVKVLQESLEADGAAFFHSPTSRGDDDPPDCEARLFDGGRIGIEVTEIVEGLSIAAEKSGKPAEWRSYSPEEIERILADRIRAKDCPTDLKGAPYDSYVLVICTDENRVLNYELIQHIRSLKFEKCNLIDRCFLLMSYSPWEAKCPYVELKLGSA